MNCEGDMCDKFPGFMLFGRRIPVPECQVQTNSTTMNACRRNSKQTEVEVPSTENSEQSKNSSDLRDSKHESLHNVETSSTDQDKVFKKPDKILRCPRCNSLETKFCYFNNYNVNQPRHFCRNCQRYWTAGGTMRNVPVGAGRRKNKHINPQYQHMIVASDGIPTADSSSHQHVSTLESAAVLKFGPDAPFHESMDAVLNLINHKRSFDESSINCTETGEEEASLCGSSVTNTCTQGNVLSDNNRSKSLQSYPFPPLVFPLSPCWNNVASMVQSSRYMGNPYSTDPTAMQWCPVQMMAASTICQPPFPFQFVPGSYWHGTVSIGSNGCISPSSSTSNSCCSGNGSPTLGKHTRDTVFTDEEKSEMCVLVPKTLRIDGPNDASKSPI